MKFVCSCLISWMDKKKRSAVEEDTPPDVEMQCEMVRKPPKPRCQTCKLGLMTCWKHMVPCSKPAFIACNFCSMFTSGDCQNKICCEGAARRIDHVEEKLKEWLASASNVSSACAARAMNDVPVVRPVLPLPMLSVSKPFQPMTAGDSARCAKSLPTSSASNVNHTCARALVPDVNPMLPSASKSRKSLAAGSTSRCVPLPLPLSSVSNVNHTCAPRVLKTAPAVLLTLGASKSPLIAARCVQLPLPISALMPIPLSSVSVANSSHTGRRAEYESPN